jgi:hypothetical protein
MVRAAIGLPKVFDVIRQELGSDILASPIERKLQDLAPQNPGTRFDEHQWTRVTPFGRRVLDYLMTGTDPAP